MGGISESKLEKAGSFGSNGRPSLLPVTISLHLSCSFLFVAISNDFDLAIEGKLYQIS
jgi:hypothetical protein